MYHCIIIVVPVVAIVQYIHVVALVGLQERREGGRAFACNMIASTNPCLLTSNCSDFSCRSMYTDTPIFFESLNMAELGK